MRSIFEYLDYRAFLRDFYAYEKSLNASFSYRAFAAQIMPSLANSGLLSGVLKGQRNLGASMRGKFARAMQLKSAESQFFELLVQFNQAKELEDKNQFFLQLASFRKSRAKLVSDGHYKFYSRWYYVVLWNYFGMEHSQKNPEKIAKALFPSVTAGEVAEGIELLLQLGLITKMTNGYGVVEKHVATDAEFRGEVAMQYNQQLLNLASTALHEVRPKFRRLNTIVFSLSEEGIAKVQERAMSFFAELQGIIERDKKADRVYSLAMHLFPNTQIPTMLE